MTRSTIIVKAHTIFQFCCRKNKNNKRPPIQNPTCGPAAKPTGKHDITNKKGAKIIFNNNNSHSYTVFVLFLSLSLISSGKTAGTPHIFIFWTPVSGGSELFSTI